MRSDWSATGAKSLQSRNGDRQVLYDDAEATKLLAEIRDLQRTILERMNRSVELQERAIQQVDESMVQQKEAVGSARQAVRAQQIALLVIALIFVAYFIWLFVR